MSNRVTPKSLFFLTSVFCPFLPLIIIEVFIEELHDPAKFAKKTFFLLLLHFFGDRAIDLQDNWKAVLSGGQRLAGPSCSTVRKSNLRIQPSTDWKTKFCGEKMLLICNAALLPTLIPIEEFRSSGISLGVIITSLTFEVGLLGADLGMCHLLIDETIQQLSVLFKRLNSGLCLFNLVNITLDLLLHRQVILWLCYNCTVTLLRCLKQLVK